MKWNVLVKQLKMHVDVISITCLDSIEMQKFVAGRIVIAIIPYEYHSKEVKTKDTAVNVSQPVMS